jgi:hypothetical protein
LVRRAFQLMGHSARWGGGCFIYSPSPVSFIFWLVIAWKWLYRFSRPLSTFCCSGLGLNILFPISVSKIFYAITAFVLMNSLKPSGKYLPPVLTTNNFSLCIYDFRMIITVNSDLFLKQRYSTHLCKSKAFLS